ncbi:MAG: glycoside hydrolase family 99-like domain-containing protein [Lachnospiraceae bacterium]|nr:glycoside hydrolase family 99-like domain-containing protein [Lachnospiraceae bacterium]
MQTKAIAMYLPQYHRIPENDKWWGEGYTDWVAVKSSEPLYKGHIQPRVPLNDNYYDLSDADSIRWQAALAGKYGIYGFAIYHYWFSSEQVLLKKPAEIIRDNEDIDINYFFVWDNNSWTRTWSRIKHNANSWAPKIDNGINDGSESLLAKLEYGDEAEWEKHFDYLLPFFKDSRYIKIDNKPVFSFFNYNDKNTMKKMFDHWNGLAKESGFAGMYFLGRLNPYDHMEGFDGLFTYEPMFSAWQNKNIINRVINKVKDILNIDNGPVFYDYDKVWGSILGNAEKCNDTYVMFGGFVDYDDSPRRGMNSRIVKGASPEKFGKYLKRLIEISDEKNNPFVFITAWNEWGESAYLEPDNMQGFDNLEVLSKLSIDETAK